MAGNILTPVAIWDGFQTDIVPERTVIEEQSCGDVKITRCFIEGRKINQQRVKIFVTITESVSVSSAPAILLVEDFEVGYDEKLAKDLANRGYYVVSIDLAGEREGCEYFTQYPEEISYANYQNVKDKLYMVENDVVQTCWYEWGCVIRYVIAHLKAKQEITSIGALGFGESATSLWHVAGFDTALSCVVFALNAGWLGYRDIHKFSGQIEPQFSDDAYKFLAGIEPQAYASRVKCPTLIVSPTNSRAFDCDRAFDTISRMDKDVYTAIHYSVGYRNRVSGEAYNDVISFFEEYLLNDGKNELPCEPDIKMEIVNGKAIITVSPDDNGLKNVSVYVSEQITEPSKRCWVKLTKPDAKTEEGFVFEYSPYYQSGVVTAFAKAQNKKGFVVGSAVICKKFQAEEVFKGYKSNVVYSSRKENAESIFSAANQDAFDNSKIDFSSERRVQVLKGPMDIPGVYCKWGLLTFKINALKDKPNEDAIFMFDCYSKDNKEITVKMITDYYGNKTEYMAKVNLLGGEIWHNVKLEKIKFKTTEGLSLKSYEQVTAIEFDGEGEWLINNALWV